MSSDTIDQACDYEQRDREVCIALARLQAERQDFPAKGCCYNCEAPVGPGERYCDGECLRDHMARRDAEARNRGPAL